MKQTIVRGSKADRSTDEKTAAWAWGPAFLLLWGALGPTAVDGFISVNLIVASTVMLIGLDLFAVFHWGSSNRRAQAAGICVLLIPAAVTIMAHAERVAWGALMPYTLLAALYFLNLRPIKLTRSVNNLYTVVSIVLLGLAAAVVYDASLVKDFFIEHWSSHYDELIPHMLAESKPVGPFATHSVAALFYYLFFLLHLRSYQVLKRRYNLALALGFLAVIPLLKSNAGLAFTIIAFAQLLVVLFRHKSTRSKIYGGIIVTALAGFLWTRREAFIEVLTPILSSNVNGLAGRFSQSGVLRANMAFVLEHPFAPVGFAYRSQLFYGDCGYLEMLIRGSFPLFIAVYGGMVSFLRQSLRSKDDVRWLLLAIGVMEVGFSNVIAMRFLYLLPFVIVYLNSLELARLGKAARAA